MKINEKNITLLARDIAENQLNKNGSLGGAAYLEIVATLLEIFEICHDLDTTRLAKFIHLFPKNDSALRQKIWKDADDENADRRSPEEIAAERMEKAKADRERRLAEMRAKEANAD